MSSEKPDAAVYDRLLLANLLLRAGPFARPYFGVGFPLVAFGEEGVAHRLRLPLSLGCRGRLNRLID